MLQALLKDIAKVHVLLKAGNRIEHWSY